MKTSILYLLIIAVVATKPALYLQSRNRFVSTEEHFVFYDTTKKPFVTLQDTIVSPFSYLMIRDTAASEEDLNRVMITAYEELFTLAKSGKAEVRRLMAFYHSSPPPYMLDVANEVDRFPAVVGGRVAMNKMKGGTAIVAHYRGPYNQINNAYRAINHWMTTHNRKNNGSPFEVYLNSPATVSDPYDLETDVYQLYK